MMLSLGPCKKNYTFDKKVKEEINKLLWAKFIYESERTKWVPPIVVLSKKMKTFKCEIIIFQL